MLILYKQVSKNSIMVHFGPIGRHLHLFETAQIVWPQKHELEIVFIKQTPFQVENFEILPNWADWQTPPFVQNGQDCLAPNI